MKLHTLLIGALSVSTLLAQEKPADGFPNSETGAAAEKVSESINLSICYETFSLPLGEDGQTVDLRIVPEMITQSGRDTWGQGLASSEAPVFETQRFNTSFVSRIDQPFLIGTINRPPVSKVDPDSANRVWFAFVTATLVKP